MIMGELIAISSHQSCSTWSKFHHFIFDISQDRIASRQVRSTTGQLKTKITTLCWYSINNESTPHVFLLPLPNPTHHTYYMPQFKFPKMNRRDYEEHLTGATHPAPAARSCPDEQRWNRHPFGHHMLDLVDRHDWRRSIHSFSIGFKIV